MPKEKPTRHQEMSAYSYISLLDKFHEIWVSARAERDRLLALKDNLNPLEYRKLEYIYQLIRGIEIEYHRTLQKTIGKFRNEKRDYEAIIKRSKDELGNDFHEYWIVSDRGVGLLIPFTREEIPHIQNLRQEWEDDEITLGQILYQLSRYRSKKNDFHDLDKTQFTFILRTFQRISDKYGEFGLHNIINFFEFAQGQHHEFADQPIITESLPSELKEYTLVLEEMSKKKSDIWQTSLQYRSFAQAFMSTFLNALIDVDSSTHVLAVELLNSLLTIRTLENGSETVDTPNLIAYLFSFAARKDSTLGTNYIVSLLRSLQNNYLITDDEQIAKPEWAGLLYTYFLEGIKGDHTIYGISESVYKLVEKSAHRYSREICLQKIQEMIAYFIRKKDTEFLVTERVMSLTGDANSPLYDVLNLHGVQDFFINVRYQNEDEVVYVRTLIKFNEQIAIFNYIVDLFVVDGESEPQIRIFPNVIDPKVIQDDPEMVKALLYILQESITIYLQHEETLELLQQHLREKKKEDKKNGAKNSPQPNNAKHNSQMNTSPGTTQGEAPKQHHRYVPRKEKRSPDEGDQNGDTSYLLGEIKAQRNLQPIVLPGEEDEVFARIKNKDVIAFVINKIKEYNAVVTSNNSEKRGYAHAKPFDGRLLGPNKRRLFQLRAGRYRVLCEFGEGKNATATILEIFLKTDETAKEIFEKYT